MGGIFAERLFSETTPVGGFFAEHPLVDPRCMCLYRWRASAMILSGMQAHGRRRRTA